MKSSNSPNKNIHFFYNNNISFIKAGKGYDHKGKPVGTVKGRCKHKEIKEQQTIYGIIPLPQECNGTIIALKISTNNKGFETSIEQVCDKCGFVTSTAFQVLNKETKNYKTTYYTSHEDWLKQNKTDKIFKEPLELGTDAYFENWVHITGNRSNDIYFDDKMSSNYMKPRLKQAVERLNKTNASKKMPKKTWRENQYKEYAEECQRTHNFSKTSLEDIKFYINKYGIKFFHRRASYQEIIYDMFICLNNSNLKVNSVKTLNTINKRIEHILLTLK